MERETAPAEMVRRTKRVARNVYRYSVAPAPPPPPPPPPALVPFPELLLCVLMLPGGVFVCVEGREKDGKENSKTEDDWDGSSEVMELGATDKMCIDNGEGIFETRGTLNC